MIDKNKIEIQNETIELIEDWILRGKPLGMSNPQNILDLYEIEIQKLKDAKETTHHG